MSLRESLIDDEEGVVSVCCDGFGAWCCVEGRKGLMEIGKGVGGGVERVGFGFWLGGGAVL